MVEPKDSWKIDYLKLALDRLYTKDQYVIAPGRERVASAALNLHLYEVLGEAGFLAQFPDVRVNAEFQNEGDANERKKNREGQFVVPDIIVHVPGKPVNVAVIEVKGYWHRAKHRDVGKLQGYLRDQGYAFAYFVQLGQENAEIQQVEPE